MLFGLLILSLGALALIPLELWVHRNLSGFTDTLAEHVYLPLARVILIIGFLYAIFPSPMLSPEVMQLATDVEPAGPAWQTLINVLFLIALLLPLLPETQQFGAVILPLQSLIGTWLFIQHFEESSGLTLHIGGGNQWLIPFALALLASHFVLRGISRMASRAWSIDALSFYDSIVLVAQPPLVLLFSRSFVIAA